MLAFLLCAFASGTRPVVVLAQCVTIDGHRLKIRPAAGNRHSRIDWKARDKLTPFLISDPRGGTTSVELFANGVSVLSLSYSISSAAAWKPSGNPIRQWRYLASKDAAPIPGINKLKSRNDRFQLKGRGGIVDSIAAPLALPITIRISDSSGTCYLAQFSRCRSNDDRSIRCDADPATSVCQGSGALPAASGTDRTIQLDLSHFAPYPEPNPLRSFNIAQQFIEVGDRLEAIDQTFGSANEISSPRTVRLEFSTKHWPDLGFNDPLACDYAGVIAGSEPRPTLDKIIEGLSAEGDEIMLRMSATPASLSSDCDPIACAGRMRRGEGCSCNHPAVGLGGYSSFAPRAYDQAFRDFWGCVIKHYAELGVRHFEIWNEPDVPGSFSPDPSDASPMQPQFLTMFEQIRLALEQEIASDPVLQSIAGQIEIGGPALSREDGAFPGRSPLLPTLLARVDKDEGELDFVSFHMYVSDPGGPFAAGTIDKARAAIPAGWTNTRLDIDEWQTALGDHTCQLQADGVAAPVAGLDSSVNCDHRGAGYAGYSLAGFLAAGSDVRPYVFDMFERNDLAPDDFYETAMGLVTTHLLPKPEAGVFWAAAQMRNNLLGVAAETTTDRSFGWIAAADPAGVIHILLSQFDSDGKMHFTRSYRAAGFEMDALAAACGCANAADPKEQNRCLRAVLDQIAASEDRSAELASLCPGLGSQEAAAVLTGLAVSDAREAIRGTAMTVGIGIDGLACDAHPVEIYEIGPGTTTTQAFRAAHPAPAAFGDFNSLYSDSEWLDLQQQLWAQQKTPTQAYSVLTGQSLEALEVPAYGAVYLRIR